jgi:hypothetical protein
MTLKVNRTAAWKGIRGFLWHSKGDSPHLNRKPDWVEAKADLLL